MPKTRSAPDRSRSRGPHRSRGLRRLSVPPLALLAGLVVLLPAAAARADHDTAYQDGAYANAAYGDAGSVGDGYYDDGAPADYASGYSYVRNLRGDATLIQAGGERNQLEVNQPVLVGDRLWVAPGSLAEVLLSDGNLLRLDGGSEVVFDALAGSPESRDRATVLRLLEGNVQLVVFSDALGDEMPRVDLPNGTAYIGDAGRYRLTSDRGDWSQVVVRSGWAEIATERGSEVVRAGGEALVEGGRAPQVALRQAGGFDTLERWGERLDSEVAEPGDVDPSLRYAAAPLDDHGSWLYVGQQRAWRPTVTVGWSPYSDGRWDYTPLGLTWVSYEPWGWVPYHYGSWDLVPGYGWVWFPGRTFSPARVYWYWGPSHVAWVPAGYYQRHYRGWGYGGGFRLGVYGWVGGDWGLFADWTVCETGYFGHRYQNRHVHDGRYWQRHDRGHALPRGLLTTDTRGLTPNRWRQPEEALRALRTRPGRSATSSRGGTVTAELPDVTPFVARKRDLPTDVERRVLRVDGSGGARRVPAQTLHTVKPRDESRRGAGEVAFDGGGGGRAVPRHDAPTGRVAGDGGGAGSSAPRGSATSISQPRLTAPRTEATRAGGPRTDGTRTGVTRGVEPRGEERRGDGGGAQRPAAPRGSVDRGSVDRGPAPRRVVAPRGEEPRSAAPRSPRDEGRQGDAGRRSGVLRTPSAPPRVSAPRTPAPRRDSPRSDAERQESLRRDDPRGSSYVARPRTVILPGRTGSAPSNLSSSPRFRGETGAAGSPSDRGEAGRRPARVSPGSRSPVSTPPPRGERAGASESPARRVVSGVLSGRPASRAPSARTPSRTAPAPVHRPPTVDRRPTASSQRSAPPSRRAAPPARDSSSAGSASRGSSSGSRSRGTASRRSSGSSNRSSASSSSSRSSRGSSSRGSSGRSTRGRGSRGGGGE